MYLLVIHSGGALSWDFSTENTCRRTYLHSPYLEQKLTEGGTSLLCDEVMCVPISVHVFQ